MPPIFSGERTFDIDGDGSANETLLFNAGTLVLMNGGVTMGSVTILQLHLDRHRVSLLAQRRAELVHPAMRLSDELAAKVRGEGFQCWRLLQTFLEGGKLRRAFAVIEDRKSSPFDTSGDGKQRIVQRTPQCSTRM